MLKTIKIRLYPNDNQSIYMNKLIGSCRYIYNKCLSFKSIEHGLWSNPTSLKDTGKYLLELKSKNEWLKESHSKVLQQSLINLDTAYRNFFRECKKTKKKIKKKEDKKGKNKNNNGYPNYKSKHTSNQSCRFPVDAFAKSGIIGNRISIINALKDIHFKCSPNDEKYLNKNQSLIKSGTLSKTKTGNYYFSILIDKPNNIIEKTANRIIGIDLGIKDFIVTSEGQHYENLKSKRLNQNKLSRLHRELSRKVKGSNKRNQARIKLSKTYNKLTNIKEYYLHSVANQLLSENQTIVIENLNVAGMLENHNLARSIQELSLSRFKIILKYKAEWYGREVIEVGRYFPSSRLCGACGYKNKDLKLKDREWVCPECGVIHDRDLNAARNIRDEGIRIKIGLSSPELTPQEGKPVGPLGMRKENVEKLECH